MQDDEAMEEGEGVPDKDNEENSGKGEAMDKSNEEDENPKDEADDSEEAKAEGDDEDKVKSEEQKRTEEEMAKDFQDKLDILKDNIRTKDDSSSEQYAHMNQEEDAQNEDSVAALDEMKFENDIDLKFDDERNEQERKEDRSKEDGEAVNEKSKKQLDQKLSEQSLESLKEKRVQTSTVSRGNVSQFSENRDKIGASSGKEALDEDIDMEAIAQSEITEELTKGWGEICAQTSDLTRHLTEQLRLILEPTKATRLKGDYKTGKRINMRKIIPYIASHFRKDRIWLRRTKPHKRDCEIVLAMDDSSSMADNSVKELSFASVATLAQALTVLEVGKLGIVRFGEEAKVVHPLKKSFGLMDGANLLSAFSFEQKVTKVVDLLSLTSKMFSSQSDLPLSKLLIVLSDGKGILNEGKGKVTEAVRAMKLLNIFVIFLIVEAEESRESVLDIRTTTYDDKGNLKSLDPYMEHFPFPFYIILRDIKNLPDVIGDALRQWLEMVNNSSN